MRFLGSRAPPRQLPGRAIHVIATGTRVSGVATPSAATPADIARTAALPTEAQQEKQQRQHSNALPRRALPHAAQTQDRGVRMGDEGECGRLPRCAPRLAVMVTVIAQPSSKRVS
jgi:hypothetical protein